MGAPALLGEKGTSLCNGWDRLWLIDSRFSSDSFRFFKMEKKVRSSSESERRVLGLRRGKKK